MAISPKQAVIIDNVPESTIDDYLRGITETLSGQEITHASRISGGRVCVFLKDEDAVAQITLDGFITVNNELVPIRRFSTAATKIMLSNVYPFITSQMLQNEIVKFGKLTGPIRDISTGSKIDECLHVKSFRKIAYVLIEDLSAVPETLRFEVEGMNHIVFISMDDVLCHKCKRKGHIMKNCKNTTDTEQNSASLSTKKSPQDLRNFPNLPTLTRTFADAVAATSAEAVSLRPEAVRSPSGEAKGQHQKEITNSVQLSDATVMSVRVKNSTERINDLNQSQQQTLLLNTDSPAPPTEILATPALDIGRVCGQRKLSGSEHTPKRPRLFHDNDDSDSGSVTSVGSHVSMAESEISNASQQDPEIGEDAALTKQILTPEVFKNFLKKARHYKKILPIVHSFTKDHTALRIELEDYLKIQSDKNIKRRIERMINSIAKETQTGHGQPIDS